MARVTVRNVVKTVQRITAWSFSRWKEYEQCPFRAKCKVIDKMKEPQGPALARGEEIHGKAEHFLLDPKAKVPEELKSLDQAYRALRRKKPRVELEIAFDSGWRRVEWFDKSAWCRVKVDALVEPGKKRVVEIIDHKTGKVRSDESGHTEYDLQLDLYQVGGLTAYEKADRAEAALYFTDHGTVINSDTPLLRKDVEKGQERWVERTRAMLSDTRFDPRPGPYCRWCSFAKSKGGPCVY
jgi:CRISPR/Cas system-associated exonuclease Cas4 (RecB family)